MSELENWLRNKNMTTNEFVALVGCSRQVIWKVKRNIPIDPKIAIRIQKITGNIVSPASQRVGVRCV